MNLDDFLVRAALAGVGVALATAPLGCFVVWRRMAYFGDATAHAALLGVALALAGDLPVFGGVLVVALSMAILLTVLGGRGWSSDALLGVLSHGALALGLVAVAFLPGVRVDLLSYLLGDILAVNVPDLIVIWSGAALVLVLVVSRWSALLAATLNRDLAQASGYDPRREDLVLTLALSLAVAVALKVVGALLIAALLIIPAAAARPFARTPESMALIAAGIGVASALCGLAFSFALDTPTGPSIVATAVAIFVLSSSARALRA